jgi:hypothetical protein
MASFKMKTSTMTGKSAHILPPTDHFLRGAEQAPVATEYFPELILN